MVLAAFIMGIISMAALVLCIIGVCCGEETQEQKNISWLRREVSNLQSRICGFDNRVMPRIRALEAYRRSTENRDVSRYLSSTPQPDLRCQPEIEAQRHWDLLSGLQHEIGQLAAYERDRIFTLMAALLNKRYPATDFERHAFLAELFPDKRKGKGKRGQS